MGFHFQHWDKILSILLILFLAKGFSKPPPYPMRKPERWQDLACHPGWNNYTSNQMLGDIAKFCDRTNDQKKDCFKLCMLRELELITAKFVGTRQKFTKVYDYDVAVPSKQMRPQSIFVLYAFPGEGGLETVQKILKPFYELCTKPLLKMNAWIYSRLTCADETFNGFYKCVDDTLGCGGANGLFNG